MHTSETTSSDNKFSATTPPGCEGAEMAAMSSATSTRPRLPIITAASLLVESAPERYWLVHDWIPGDEVTLLSGDGGIGKSLLALQLGFACTTGGQWIGMDTKVCPVLYVGAEDDLKEIHYRLEKLREHDPAATGLEAFHILSLAGENALLGENKRDGRIRATDLFIAVENEVAERKVELVLLDASADMFGGDEVNRVQVRSFIQLLRGLALKKGCAVVLLAHPSVDAMKTGRGYSGNTAWNNSVRSRLYFAKAVAGGDHEPDPDLRELTLAKTNRAHSGQKIMLRYRADRFVRESCLDGSSIDRQIEVEAKFLALLRQFASEKRDVSPNHSCAFAPTAFAKHPNNGGYAKREFELAMNLLLGAQKVCIEEHGPPSRRRKRLIVADTQNATVRRRSNGTPAVKNGVPTPTNGASNGVPTGS